MDGTERAGELRGVPPAAHASPATADHQHAGTTQPRTQATHSRRNSLSERGVAVTISDCRADGTQRRMGDRKTLRDLRNQVNSPNVTQALLQKKWDGIRQMCHKLGLADSNSA